LGSEIYIEVKTTTRAKEDPEAKKFYISFNEYGFFQKNKSHYFLYRVYDIEGNAPSIDTVDMDLVELKTDNYLVTIR
jgi:hypothetical protein